MKKLKFSDDIALVLKILKEENVLIFENDIPYFFIEMIYDFLWGVIYKAKILSRYKGKRGIDTVDIKIALTLKLKKNKAIDFSENGLKHIINIINNQRLHKKPNNSVFKFPILNRSFLNDELKIVGNIFNY
nr:transcription initiation factor TFIID subunit 9 [Cryptomonas curvata]|mmetsp:Transcript_13276/g.28354  ORF Transcript_13276/g.28354 Transcript_13276/m.28354 type:complete len:131 (+) Transcript_13276:4496-4888(+)